jgi:hypothetical protein
MRGNRALRRQHAPFVFEDADFIVADAQHRESRPHFSSVPGV